MFKRLFKKEEIKSIGTGIIKELNEVPDKIFAEKMLGDGFALELTDNEVCAPLSGELVSVFPTGHAYGIKSKEYEVLVHIGIDTVELEGAGFDIKVKQGETVKQGDVLAVIDLDYIQRQGKATISPVIFTSGEHITINKLNETVDKNTENIITISK